MTTPQPEAGNRASLSARVAAATAGRDRVLDAAKLSALLMVIIGHSIAWDVTDGAAQNILEERSDLVWLTWIFQVLPLFFAAGAVSNAASWRRSPGVTDYWSRRVERLAGPVLVYAGIWTLLLLPLALVQPDLAVMAGIFFAQLLWFAAVYLAVAAAAPLTTRWRERPVLTLTVWLAVILLVDLLRLNVSEVIGWINLLLVWGWLHQVGYSLPAARRHSRWLLAAAAGVALAVAVAVAVIGPYSSSLVSIGSDQEASNLAPPSIVTAIYGLAVILLLAAIWPWLSEVLRRPRVWTPVALLGARGMGLYLWHIPIVGAAVALALAPGDVPGPFDWQWAAIHTASALAAIGGAWVLAGAVAPAERWLDRLGSARLGPGADHSARVHGGSVHAGMVTFLLAAGILYISVIGFGTWWGRGAMGIPGSSAVSLALLALLWWIRPRRSTDDRAGQ